MVNVINFSKISKAQLSVLQSAYKRDCLVNVIISVISLSLSQSDHIKPLPLYIVPRLMLSLDCQDQFDPNYPSPNQRIIHNLHNPSKIKLNL